MIPKKPHPGTQPAGKSQAKPTLKQRKFAVALVGPAKGNQTEAARIAGYKGSQQQLAVQGCVNAKNPKIQEIITSMLDAMVGHGLERLAEALDATKVRSFLTKMGEIVQCDPEPDHGVRLEAVGLMFRLRNQPPSSQGTITAQDVIQPENDQRLEERRKEVAALHPADRMLVRQAGEIEEELAKVERHGLDPMDFPREYYEDLRQVGSW